MTLFVGRYDSHECEIELENISMDDNGNWTCLILESFLTNQTDQDTVNVKVIGHGSTGCWVFKWGVQNWKDFCVKINIPKGNYWIEWL